MRALLLIPPVLLWLAAAGPALAEATPEELVRSTADVILAEIRQNREIYARDYDRLYKMADEKVLPHFDFRRMAQWVLGRHWREASPEQRDRFVAAFRDLLVRTYSQALLNYKDEQIVYLPPQRQADGEEVLVRTEVRRSGGQPNIPIHYSFYRNRDGAWKVYDVTIEGVSLVTNYRSVYAGRIRDQGLDVLIAEIEANNRQARGAGAKR